MPRRSTVQRLEPEVRRYLERCIAAGRLTLDELLIELRQKFPASAHELPSRSAVHRYGQKLERRLAAIKASTEAAKIIRAETDDSEDARSEALTALIQTELFDTILSLQEASEADVDPQQRVKMLSSAAKNIATLSRSSVSLKRYQAEAVAAARKALLEEQRAALDAMPAKGGVTEQTKAAIRAALGIA